MTSSLMDAYISQLPAARARMVMMMAEAAVYPHIKPSSAQRIWNSWSAQIYRAAQAAADAVAQRFTVNGAPVKVSGLKRWVSKRLEGAEIK